MPEQPRLSPRQKQVIELLAAGLLRKEVAEKLGISINTIKHHAKQAFRKLGAVYCAQAMATYYKPTPGKGIS